MTKQIVFVLMVNDNQKIVFSLRGIDYKDQTMP